MSSQLPLFTPEEEDRSGRAGDPPPPALSDEVADLVDAILNAPDPDALESLAGTVLVHADSPDIVEALARIVAYRHASYSPDQRGRATQLLALLAWNGWKVQPGGYEIRGLTEALKHEEPIIRMDAALGLGKLQATDALDALLARLNEDDDLEVRQAIAAALSALALPDVVQPVLEAYEADLLPYDICYDALFALGKTALEPLLGVMKRWNKRVVSRALAADLLGVMGAQDAYPSLIRIIDRPHEHPDVRVAAAQALGRLGDPAAISPLQQVYTEYDVPRALLRAVDEAIALLVSAERE